MYRSFMLFLALVSLGYLKYMKPNKRELEARQRVFADILRVRFDIPDDTDAASGATAVSAIASAAARCGSISFF